MGRLRMWDWIVYALALTAIIAVLAPQQIGVSVYKLSLVSAAAAVGYWIDRSLYPYARPDRIDSPIERSAAMVRRAIIVAACMIGVSLGS